jgi:4-diphosphocytidyl-2-C-methyl-D-erythritol kinase
VILHARAKINLALDVLYKRDDGYHEVAMIMQSIALADRVGLFEQDEGIAVTTNIAGLDSGPANLAYRAAALIASACGVRRGIRITLDKKIPLAAGLAGGSSDAAAVLNGLNQLWGLGLSMTRLEELAASLGSDVPFCLRGGTMLATGRGEKLSPLPTLPHCWVVLAKPPVEVSTAWVYGNYHPEVVVRHPDIDGMITSLRQRDLAGVTGKLGNVLESVTVPAHPDIAKLKESMLEYGAMASLMSGSGPTVFALVQQRDQAESIAEKIKRQTNAQIIITETACASEGENGTTVVAN